MLWFYSELLFCGINDSSVLFCFVPGLVKGGTGVVVGGGEEGVSGVGEWRGA